ncbi:YlmC/YmxH family sporulation protein [Clostridium frigidicarnis]|uniref:Sporulation protein, YlmC/YmxH family n=1 Tax=Clostridium frigidicarnis TaxID=84698 RepID=A0A1I0VNI3_9CLOT|nr:YlmC/YmxH family sporulation protein [Clostridium frigidicarnis]SFA77902.1 sporulation protein, YlmC/YmxH family [Clostridium frigidicarnis]
MDLDSMHSVNQLRTMEVIDINLGMKLGYIKDLKIDCDNYKILALVLPEEKASWFKKEDAREIPWENVVKIGVDVILVNYNKTNSNEV